MSEQRILKRNDESLSCNSGSDLFGWRHLARARMLRHRIIKCSISPGKFLLSQNRIIRLGCWCSPEFHKKKNPNLPYVPHRPPKA